MPVMLAPPEQRVLLHNVSWETYERLIAESVNCVGTRFTYNSGDLEIITVSMEHEHVNRTLAMLIEIVAEETGKSVLRTGSATFRRQDLSKGFEPDSGFYIQHARQMQGRMELDPAVDPPPDLVIEVDIIRSSLDRFAIFAAVGVPEVWRYDGERVAFHALNDASYVESGLSAALPPLTAEQAGDFVKESLREDSLVWVRRVREWVRARAK